MRLEPRLRNRLSANRPPDNAFTGQVHRVCDGPGGETPERSRTLPQAVLCVLVIDGYPTCADRHSHLTLQGEYLRIDDVGLNSEGW